MDTIHAPERPELIWKPWDRAAQKQHAQTPLRLVWAGGGLRGFFALGCASALWNPNQIAKAYASSSGATFCSAYLVQKSSAFVDLSCALAPGHKKVHWAGFWSSKPISHLAHEAQTMNQWIVAHAQDACVRPPLKVCTYQAQKKQGAFATFRGFFKAAGHAQRMLNHSKKTAQKEFQADAAGALLQEYAKLMQVLETFGGRKHCIIDIQKATDAADWEHALLASCAVPPIVMPMRQSYQYWDGGLVHPLPLHLALLDQNETPELRQLPLVCICNTKAQLALAQEFFNVSARKNPQLGAQTVYYIVADKTPKIGMFEHANGGAMRQVFEQGQQMAEKIKNGLSVVHTQITVQ